jgi:hypothetical protein
VETEGLVVVMLLEEEVAQREGLQRLGLQSESDSDEEEEEEEEEEEVEQCFFFLSC